MPDTFTTVDAPVLATLYAEALTEGESRAAEAEGGPKLSAGAIVAVANYAAVIALARHGIVEGDENPDLVNPTHNGKPIDPMLNVLALLVEQVGRVADNTAHAEVHVSIEQVLDAWETTGMRADQDLALDFLKALPGVVVDQ